MEYKIEKIVGHGKMTGVAWDVDGIIIGHGTTNYTRKDDHTSISKDDIVRLHFGVKGDYQFTHKQLNQSFDLIGGHHNLMYSKEFEMTVHNKTLTIETFGVNFPKSAFINYIDNTSDDLKKFGESVMEGKSVILSDKWGTINAPIQNILFDIKHNAYKDNMQQLFLLSKSIELLVLSSEACIKQNKKKETVIITKRDKEKVIAARDFINSRISNPPNLTEVSKHVGLNEYKLKLGFKEMFSTTLFGYLTEQRLHLARVYLQDTAKTALEISLELGYATPQHFNNAFKKKYGQTPLSLKNNPKNAMP